MVRKDGKKRFQLLIFSKHSLVFARRKGSAVAEIAIYTGSKQSRHIDNRQGRFITFVSDMQELEHNFECLIVPKHDPKWALIEKIQSSPKNYIARTTLTIINRRFVQYQEKQLEKEKQAFAELAY